MGADDIFDILLLVFVIAILTPIMLVNTLPLFKGSIGGFETLVEKTAQMTEGEITYVEDAFKKNELLLMVVVADDMGTEPSKLQISIDKNNNGVIESDELSPEITFDEIIKDKFTVLNIINSYIPDDRDLKLCTSVSDAGIEKWMVLEK